LIKPYSHILGLTTFNGSHGQYYGQSQFFTIQTSPICYNYDKLGHTTQDYRSPRFRNFLPSSQGPTFANSKEFFGVALFEYWNDYNIWYIDSGAS